MSITFVSFSLSLINPRPFSQIIALENCSAFHENLIFSQKLSFIRIDTFRVWSVIYLEN